MIKLQSSMSKHIPVSETFQHIYIYLCLDADSRFIFEKLGRNLALL